MMLILHIFLETWAPPGKSDHHKSAPVATGGSLKGLRARRKPLSFPRCNERSVFSSLDEETCDLAGRICSPVAVGSDDIWVRMH